MQDERRQRVTEAELDALLAHAQVPAPPSLAYLTNLERIPETVKPARFAWVAGLFDIFPARWLATQGAALALVLAFGIVFGIESAQEAEASELSAFAMGTESSLMVAGVAP